jgi:hypothetical protein
MLVDNQGVEPKFNTLCGSNTRLHWQFGYPCIALRKTYQELAVVSDGHHQNQDHVVTVLQGDVDFLVDHRILREVHRARIQLPR